MDDKTQAHIEWIENRLKKFRETAVVLEHVIKDYLEWMAVNAYAQSTQRRHKQTLGKFLSFIREGRYLWDEVFIHHTLRRFKKIKGLPQAHGVTGLARYLYNQGKIAQPIRARKALPPLPGIYEDYLLFQKRYRQRPDVVVKQIRRVLCAFDDHCKRSGIELRLLKIEHVDTFQKVFFKNFAGKPDTLEQFKKLRAGIIDTLGC
jgi:hypothetical protein